MADQTGPLQTITERASGHQDSILARLVTLIIDRLTRLGASDWYSEREVRAAAEDIAALVRAGQGTIGDLTAATMKHTLTVGGIDAPQPKPVALDKDLRGISEVDVWERPAKAYRTARLRGASEFEAQTAAFTRAKVLAGDDLRLAERTAAVHYLETVKGVTGYRRVLHPELSRSGVCGLCVAASTRVYRKDRLMPVHTRCKCGIVPVTRAWDAGKALNATSLAAYASVGSTDRAELKRARFRIEDHGELGPQLIPADAPFVGPADLLQAG